MQPQNTASRHVKHKVSAANYRQSHHIHKARVHLSTMYVNYILIFYTIRYLATFQWVWIDITRQRVVIIQPLLLTKPIQAMRISTAVLSVMCSNKSMHQIQNSCSNTNYYTRTDINSAFKLIRVVTRQHAINRFMNNKKAPYELLRQLSDW